MDHRAAFSLLEYARFYGIASDPLTLDPRYLLDEGLVDPSATFQGTSEPSSDALQSSLIEASLQATVLKEALSISKADAQFLSNIIRNARTRAIDVEWDLLSSEREDIESLKLGPPRLCLINGEDRLWDDPAHFTARFDASDILDVDYEPRHQQKEMVPSSLHDATNRLLHAFMSEKLDCTQESLVFIQRARNFGNLNQDELAEILQTFAGPKTVSRRHSADDGVLTRRVRPQTGGHLDDNHQSHAIINERTESTSSVQSSLNSTMLPSPASSGYARKAERTPGSHCSRPAGSHVPEQNSSDSEASGSSLALSARRIRDLFEYEIPELREPTSVPSENIEIADLSQPYNACYASEHAVDITGVQIGRNSSHTEPVEDNLSSPATAHVCSNEQLTNNPAEVTEVRSQSTKALEAETAHSYGPFKQPIQNRIEEPQQVTVSTECQASPGRNTNCEARAKGPPQVAASASKLEVLIPDPPGTMALTVGKLSTVPAKPASSISNGLSRQVSGQTKKRKLSLRASAPRKRLSTDKPSPQSGNDDDGTPAISSGLATLGSLSSFMQTRGKRVARTVSKCAFFASVEKDQASSGACPPQQSHGNRSERASRTNSKPSMPSKRVTYDLVPQVPVRNDEEPFALVVSTTLLKTHSFIIQALENLENARVLIHRELTSGMPDAPAESPIWVKNSRQPRVTSASNFPVEADIIISPTTGIVLSTFQAITQLYLPGHKPSLPEINHIHEINSPLRERLYRVHSRYEKLYVFLCHSCDSSASAYAPHPDPSVSDSLSQTIEMTADKALLSSYTSFTAFCTSLSTSSSSTMAPLIIPADPHIVTQWM